MKRLTVIAPVVVFAFLFASNVFATGYSDPVNIGPQAIGMGGAFVGIADDPTAVYHNPAAIVNMKGHRLYLGVDTNWIDFQFTPPAGAVESSKKTLSPAPFFFYTKDITENAAFGLGVYFPHGNIVEYSSASANFFQSNEGGFLYNGNHTYVLCESPSDPRFESRCGRSNRTHAFKSGKPGIFALGRSSGH